MSAAYSDDVLKYGERPSIYKYELGQRSARKNGRKLSKRAAKTRRANVGR